MLSQKYRLTRKKDFEKIFKKGKKLKEDFLILAIAKNNLNRARFGFIVSQKVSKKAAIRNKIKRRLREITQTKLNKIQKGIDIVFVALPGLEKKDFWEIKKITNKLFQKTKCLKV